MKIVHRRCAGLDVHKDTAVACVRILHAGRLHQEVRTFRTTTDGLLELCDWLTQNGCTHAAMESTGVYWKPVWHVLEGALELVLANATHIRNLPGRKTDVSDAMWISDLLAHGLIRASFVPETPIQELRDLTRTRKQLVREIAQHIQRIEKTLEDANLKITGLISDVLGTSGRAILEAIVAGESDPQKLLDRTEGRLKANPDHLLKALAGRIRPHHRFLIGLHLKQIDALERGVRDLETCLKERLEPFRSDIELVTPIPGISELAAWVVVSEIGFDMRRFPTASHLVSWTGLCPRSDESAGKKRSTRTRDGNPWLKTLMVQCAWAASRKKNSYFRAQFLRLRARHGPMKAIVAVAASLLTTIYYVLLRHEPYRDLGADHFDRRDPAQLAKRLVKRLNGLGFKVQIQAPA
jgi:transposase